MIQITENLSVVVVPEHAIRITLYKSDDRNIFVLRWIDDILNVIDMPDGDYKILGTITASEIDFEIDEDWVDWHERQGFETRWYDFTNHNSWLPTIEQSFRSLLTSKGVYWENPYERPNVEDDEDNAMARVLLNQWQQAEQQKLQLNQKLIAIWRIQ